MGEQGAASTGVKTWGCALYVLAGAILVGAVYVAVRVWCWHGCVNPFDPQWQRLSEAAAIAQEEAGTLHDGQRTLVELPDEYEDLAEGGEVAVERVDGELMVIFLRIPGGAGLRNSAMVYAPGGIADRGRLLDDYCIDTVYSQGGSWYEVFLDDYVPVLGPCR